MIYDILLVAVCAICMIIGSKRGAVTTIVTALTSVVSFIFASFLGEILAAFIYDRFIFTRIQKSIFSAFADNSLGDSASSFDKLIDSLPDYVKAALSLSGNDANSVLKSTGESLASSAVSAVDTAVRGLVISFLAAVLCILLFIIIRLIIRYTVARAIINSFRHSSLHPADMVLGTVLGLVSAFFTLSFIAFLLHLFLPYAENIPVWLSEESVNNSLIFRYIYNGNIFTAVSNFFTGV